MRDLIIHPKILNIIRGYSGEVRREVGQAIRDLQSGLSIGMPLSRPMPSVALGVAEIRVRDRNGVYRVFYYLKSKRGVIVFYAFTKKTQKTPEPEITLARKYLREILNEKEA